MQHRCSVYSIIGWITVLVMTRCQGYGTVLGCSMCIVDLTSDSDLSRLSSLSIISILYSIMSIPAAQQSKLLINEIQIQCNGIIRIPDNFATDTHSKNTIAIYNKNFCVSLLQRWKNNYTLLGSSEMENNSILQCISNIEQSQETSEINLHLYNTVIQLYSLYQ